MDDLAGRANQIGVASVELRHRGLSNAAAWIIELIAGVDSENMAQAELEFANGRMEAQETCDKSQVYTMGLNYYRMQEYLRAADYFHRCSSLQGTFMKYQSRYRAECKKRR